MIVVLNIGLSVELAQVRLATAGLLLSGMVQRDAMSVVKIGRLTMLVRAACVIVVFSLAVGSALT